MLKNVQKLESHSCSQQITFDFISRWGIPTAKMFVIQNFECYSDAMIKNVITFHGKLLKFHNLQNISLEKCEADKFDQRRNGREITRAKKNMINAIFFSQLCTDYKTSTSIYRQSVTKLSLWCISLLLFFFLLVLDDSAMVLAHRQQHHCHFAQTQMNVTKVALPASWLNLIFIQFLLCLLCSVIHFISIFIL